MAWDALYEAQPTDSTYVADTDDAIRSTKTEIRTRVAKEHGFNLSESAPQTGHGKHLRGSARVFVSNTDIADPTTVTADDADYGTGRLQVYPTTGRLRYYSGSAWVDIGGKTAGQLESSVATGTAPLVVASTTQVTNLKAQFAGTADTATNALSLGGTLASSFLKNDALNRTYTAPAASLASSGANYVIPAGTYYVRALVAPGSPSPVNYQFRDSGGNWRTFKTSDGTDLDDAMLMISDGTNARVYMASYTSGWASQVITFKVA